MARHNKTKARGRVKKQGGMKRISSGSLSPKFSMQQEARNTENRKTWTSGDRLRHKVVHFVSAGDMRPEEEEDSTPEETKQEDGEATMISELDDTRLGETQGHHDQETNHGFEEPREEARVDVDEVGEPVRHEEEPESSLFFIDLAGDKVEDTGLPDPVLRHSPAVDVDSSEDEVVFTGRNKSTSRGPSTRDFFNSTPVTNVIKIDEKWEATANCKEPDESHRRMDMTAPDVSPQPNSLTSEQDKNGSIPTTTKRRPTNRSKQRAIANEETEVLADYIANMDADYEMHIQSEMDRHLYIGTNESRSHSDTASSTDTDDSDNQELPAIDEQSSEEESEDDLESTDGTLPAYPLYEPTGVANDPDDEEQERNADDSESLASSLDLAELVDQLETDDDDDDDDDVLEMEVNSRRGPKKPVKEPKGTNGFFASATSFADALEEDPYYGFDIMDFDRPSIKNKSKGKQRAVDLMLSDSELELELESAWQNDRKSKKAKKQQREELRSQGLLGRNRSKSDLRAKYSGGVSVDDLKSEIRAFLLSSKDSLSLPPMAKQLRKLVHDMANALSLKSQSRGKGKTRFPLLYKTSRTPSYTSKTIIQVDKVFSRGRFRYRTVKPFEQKTSQKTVKSRRGRPDSSVSYMDGDVVGASAPEIGSENKGRAMLEKMGWSMGTALGASNNKGILQPVAHVVKNSKAGLG